MKTIIITAIALFFMSFQLMAQKVETPNSKIPKRKNTATKNVDLKPQKAIKKNVLINNTFKMINMDVGSIIKWEPKKAPSAM